MSFFPFVTYCVDISKQLSTGRNMTVHLLTNNYQLLLDCSAGNFLDSLPGRHTWRKNNDPIQQSDHYFMSSSALIINNVTLLDAGQYSCESYDDKNCVRETEIISLAIRSM